MSKEKVDFGKRLAEIRKSKGMNQEQLRELIDAPTVQMISGWECGHSFPSAIYLITLAKRLDVSIDYLLLGEQQSSSGEKPLRTYKDVGREIKRLYDTGIFCTHVFRTNTNPSGLRINNMFYTSALLCNDYMVLRFMEEYERLLAASNTLGPELLEQATSKLLSEYETEINKH